MLSGALVLYYPCTGVSHHMPQKETLPASIFRRIDLRILVVLSVAYIINCIDRANISFAHLSMTADLHLSEADYGMAVGIFYLGYVLFELPAAWLFSRIGAPRTFSRIMILWGLAGMAMFFCTDKTQFYGLRFLLGVFEAGFSPLALYFLSLWYPANKMGRAISIQQLAGPLSGVIVSILSGVILASMQNVWGISGWRWMFVLESFPAICLGIWILLFLPEHPQAASWLTQDEKTILLKHLPAPKKTETFTPTLHMRSLFTLIIPYVFIVCGNDIFSFWLPHFLQSTHIQSHMTIGVLSSIPYLFATLTMLTAGRLADSAATTRRTLCAVFCLCGAGALAFLAYHGTSLSSVLACSTVGLASLYGAYVVFWTLPSSVASRPPSATDFAVINTCGMIAGVLCPIIVGKLATLTGSFAPAELGTAVLMVCAAAFLTIPCVKKTI